MLRHKTHITHYIIRTVTAMMLLATWAVPCRAVSFEIAGAVNHPELLDSASLERWPGGLLQGIEQERWRIDTVGARQLRLDVEGVGFFRDNEFATPVMKGYTLPGFRLSPTLSYKPNRYIRFDLGVYMLHFWGTSEYPNMAYRDIAYWTGGDRASRGLHVLPMFRLHMATAWGLNVILGTLYGGYAHNLIEPLYAPELNLTADPETGIQMLYTNRWVDLDLWVNWESFIYRGDTHQEAFVLGFSGALKYTRPTSRLQVYSPVQVLAQHRGGEIDTIYHHSVQTLLNAAVGVGASYDFGRRWLRRVAVEADFLAYKQLAGRIWPYDDGTAYYLNARAEVGPLRPRLGLFGARRFISLMGYPMFGTVSTATEGEVYDTSSTFVAGVEYKYDFGRGFSIEAGIDYFLNRSTSNIAFGVTLRATPSFLLKRF